MLVFQQAITNGILGKLEFISNLLIKDKKARLILIHVVILCWDVLINTFPTFISLQKNVNERLTEEINCKISLYQSFKVARVLIHSFDSIAFFYRQLKKKKDTCGEPYLMLSFITLESWSFLSVFKEIINVTWANFSITVRFRVIFWWFDSV